MASTVVGQSGRVYVQGDMLQRHRENAKFSVFKAESENDNFVLKRVPRPLYNLSVRLAAEFAGSRRLRIHIDCNEEEGVLVYPYFKDTLLALIQKDPEFPASELKKILRHVGEAIQELHTKDWLHIDVKPDNILVNWTCDNEGTKTVTDAALGDFDIAFKSDGGRPCQTPFAIGNVMWRSPEGQTGMAVTKASDIFSFGLVCIYAFGGGELLIFNCCEELANYRMLPKQEILVRHFLYFGPAPEGLLRQIDSETWRKALEEASNISEMAVKEQPEMRFEWWGKDLGPNAQDMISGMTNPDPTARTTISQVLMHPWWEESD